MPNKQYRIELGINLHAATIARTNPNLRLYPLQNALIDVTGGEDAAKPAWFTRLMVGDVLSFRLVDISNLKAPQTRTSHPRLALIEFLFTDPESGLPANPFDEQLVSWQVSEQPQLLPSPAFSRSHDQELPTWGIAGRTVSGEELSSAALAEIGAGNAFKTFEMTVALKTTRDGWIDQFIFDPEMIVSETGG